jgi:hypothetical protein
MCNVITPPLPEGEGGKSSSREMLIGYFCDCLDEAQGLWLSLIDASLAFKQANIQYRWQLACEIVIPL